ncbi:MAG: CPBP family glutamic-type intramembrane protease [Cyanobacteria bacterium J06600_6]
MTTSFIAPALLEETFFRALLLPHPASNTSSTNYLLWSLISLLLFIVYHPLNAMTAFPQGKPTFFDARFLILATALGIACTTTYWQTGSIWLPIIIHWLTVVLWLSCFGGLDKLGFNFSKEAENLG